MAGARAVIDLKALGREKTNRLLRLTIELVMERAAASSTLRDAPNATPYNKLRYMAKRTNYIIDQMEEVLKDEMGA